MKITKYCQSCDASYLARADRVSRSKYCSPKCAHEGKRRRRIAINTDSGLRLPIVGGETLLDAIDRDLQSIAWHTRDGYARGMIGGRLQTMHRVVLARALGRPLQRGEMPDHINRDRLDNRRTNLRLASFYQNGANASPRKDGSSTFRGVAWYPNYRRWGAYITVHRQRIYLGYFISEEEAAYVRDQFALVLHGNFAYFNVID